MLKVRSPKNRSSYSVEPRCKFFEATKSIVEYEMRPGNTVTFISEVDLSEVEMIRARAAAAGQIKPSYTAFVVKAVALALREFPYANRRVFRKWPFFRPRLQRFHTCDLSVACERLETGAAMSTFIDIIRDADRLSLEEITQWLRNLANATPENNKQWREFSWLITKLPHWLSTLLIRLPVFVPSLWIKYRGGSVLISSPAKYGVDAVVATWSAPLGISFGLVKPRPVVKDGKVVARPTFSFVLNFDRRVMAGAQAAKFFKYMTDLLEHASSKMAPYLPKGVGEHTKKTDHEAGEYTDKMLGADAAKRAVLSENKGCMC